MSRCRLEITGRGLATLMSVALIVCATAAVEAGSLRFSVEYDASVADSYTGRVYVITSTSPHRVPRSGPSWFGRDPFFAIDVEDWKPGTPIIIDDEAISFPGPPSAVPERPYWVQAVMRPNRQAARLAAPGNPYSQNVRFDLVGDDDREISLVIDRVDEPAGFGETERVRLVEHRSELLSDFHGGDVTMRAAVILPPDYDDEPERRYPALYWIGGFGSDHTSAPWLAARWDRNGQADRIVRVVLDASCYGGHHTFADSANNGPRARALVEELIPEIERRFRLVPASTARFLAGHSSGGWASLWLQVTSPDFFGGVWSLAPDPVDFHDFQRIDLYEPEASMYVDGAGEKRPLARHGGQAVVMYEDFAKMEVVLGEGGQLRSFEWVFSPRGEDGLPRPLYDRMTGAVDHEVALAWRSYDIVHRIEQRWAELEPKLRGKIHVIMGELDNFYLEGATRRLKEALDRLGSDARIELVPGADHGSVRTPALMERIDSELLEAFDAAHDERAPGAAVP